MWVFQGHLVVALFADIALAFLWIISVRSLEPNFPKFGRGMGWWDLVVIYYFILMIPNSCYAMFELKHLLFIDTVADVPNIWSFIVFGGTALFGFFTSTYGCRLIMDKYSQRGFQRLLFNIALSLILGFGGVAGLMEYVSIMAFFPPVLIDILIQLLANPLLMKLALGTSLFFFVVNLITDYIFKPS